MPELLRRLETDNVATRRRARNGPLLAISDLPATAFSRAIIAESLRCPADCFLLAAICRSRGSLLTDGHEAAPR